MFGKSIKIYRNVNLLEFFSKVENLKFYFFLGKVKTIQKSTNIEIFLTFFMEKVNQYRNRNFSF